MNLIFKDNLFSFELIRTMGYAVSAGSDICECLETAQRIKDGNFKSWYYEWVQTAQRIERMAEASNESKHTVSARNAFLRASNYYRAAEFFLHEEKNSSNAKEAYQKSCDCFKNACKLLEYQVETLCIQYENTTLPAYYFRSNDKNQKHPVIIFNGGFDSTAEEMYFVAVPALIRGYDCVTFDGPGQGSVLRNQKLYFRPDWENVISPVVDEIVSRTDVDVNRIALIGYSFGGYLAPRATAFEPRITALVANGGIYDYFGSRIKGLSKTILLKELSKSTSPILENINGFAMKFMTAARWAINDGLWKFNAETIHQLYNKYIQYNLEGIAERITCPTLICDSDEEHFFPGQSRILMEKLICSKKMIVFTKEEGAQEHCQSGAIFRSSQQILDWLDEILQ
jgi:pimeloyl-ACP methyl ester carboxylesterase